MPEGGVTRPGRLTEPVVTIAINGQPGGGRSQAVSVSVVPISAGQQRGGQMGGDGLAGLREGVRPQDALGGQARQVLAEKQRCLFRAAEGADAVAYHRDRALRPAIRAATTQSKRVLARLTVSPTVHAPDRGCPDLKAGQGRRAEFYVGAAQAPVWGAGGHFKRGPPWVANDVWRERAAIGCRSGLHHRRIVAQGKYRLISPRSLMITVCMMMCKIPARACSTDVVLA